MSTNSLISIQHSNTGAVETIYCHNDGCFSYVGKILKEHYKTEEKVNALIALGDISSLGAEVTTDQPHSFENPVKGVTVAYHRDRGEDIHSVEASYFNDLEEFIDTTSENDFNYIFIDGEWKNVSTSGQIVPYSVV